MRHSGLAMVGNCLYPWAWSDKVREHCYWSPAKTGAMEDGPCNKSCGHRTIMVEGEGGSGVCMGRGINTLHTFVLLFIFFQVPSLATSNQKPQGEWAQMIQSLVTSLPGSRAGWRVDLGRRPRLTNKTFPLHITKRKSSLQKWWKHSVQRGGKKSLGRIASQSPWVRNFKEKGASSATEIKSKCSHWIQQFGSHWWPSLEWSLGVRPEPDCAKERIGNGWNAKETGSL